MKLIGMQVRKLFLKITSLGKVTKQDVRLKDSISKVKPSNDNFAIAAGVQGFLWFFASYGFGKFAISVFDMLDDSKSKLDSEMEEVLRNIENRRKSLREPVVKASQDSSSCNDKDVYKYTK